MRILVVGDGLLAHALREDLLDAGHEVRLLADAPSVGEPAVPRAARPVGAVLHGSPLHRPALADAADGCDALAAVSGADAVNAVVALAARRELGVPVALAAIAAPALAEALHGLPIRIVCPTTRTARELRGALVRSEVEGELLLGREAGLYRVRVTHRLVGRRLAELAHPGRLLPVAVERAGRATLATAELTLQPGDVLHVAAHDRDAVHELTGA